MPGTDVYLRLPKLVSPLLFISQNPFDFCLVVKYQGTNLEGIEV
jgi:hypothetical protein